MTSRASRVFFAGAITTALALTGCSGGDSDAGSDTAKSATTSPSADGGSESAGVETGAAGAGIDAANPPKAIASLTLPAAPEDGVASMKADLVQLKRDGKVVKAVVGLTPTFDSTSTAKQTSLYKAMNGSGPDTQLIDPVNLKLYKMFEAGLGVRLEADVVNTQVVAGQTSYYWAVLAAPPESVSKVNVAFGHGTDMFMGIPIS